MGVIDTMKETVSLIQQVDNDLAGRHQRRLQFLLVLVVGSHGGNESSRRNTVAL